MSFGGQNALNNIIQVQAKIAAQKEKTLSNHSSSLEHANSSAARLSEKH